MKLSGGGSRTTAVIARLDRTRDALNGNRTLTI
jgi:hypothetical protein